MIAAGSGGLQAVVLVGGLGTRLGVLTASTPKPLLPVAGRPFLDYLIAELARHGFTRIVLLAGYLGSQMRAVQDRASASGVSIDLIEEPSPAGTAGALVHARHLLDRCFLLLNGDSFLDFNLLDLVTPPLVGGTALGRIALRPVDDAERYGTVEVADGVVLSFAERPAQPGPGLINAGVYWLDRRVVDLVRTRPCSLERDILPALARQRRLQARTYEGYFIDIGVPGDFQRAQTELPAVLRRPAAFIDADLLLRREVQLGHGRPGDLSWSDDALDAIRILNDAGRLVFVCGSRSDQRPPAGMSPQPWPPMPLVDGLRAAGSHVDDWLPDAADMSTDPDGALGRAAGRWSIDSCRSVRIAACGEGRAMLRGPGGLAREPGGLMDLIRGLAGGGP